MNNPLDFQNQPVVNTPSQPAGPKRWAAMVGDYVKTGLILIFWTVVLFAALAGAFVACRAMYWGVTQILRALGGL